MPRPLFLPKGEQPVTRCPVARWREGDEVFYQRAACARWHPAKILDVIEKSDRVLYRIVIDQKIYLVNEHQLGYPVRRRA